MSIKAPIRIRIITPLCEVSDEMKQATLAEVAPLRALGIEFDLVTLAAGPTSIENHFDEVFAAPHVVIEAMAAERNGVDAIIIDCMGDPGLMAAREAVSIPVVGPGEAAMHMAGMMGHRFGCVSVLDSVRQIFFMHARAYGVADKLTTVRCINMPVLQIEQNLHRLPALLCVEARKAIEEDLVDTLILGCTGFVGVADDLQRLLSDAGHEVPVISPMPTAALLAASMVWGNLQHSRRAYHRPNLQKKMTGFSI